MSEDVTAIRSRSEILAVVNTTVTREKRGLSRFHAEETCRCMTATANLRPFMQVPHAKKGVGMLRAWARLAPSVRDYYRRSAHRRGRLGLSSRRTAWRRDHGARRQSRRQRRDHLPQRPGLRSRHADTMGAMAMPLSIVRPDPSNIAADAKRSRPADTDSLPNLGQLRER